MCISGVLYRLIIYDSIKYLRCTPEVNQQQTEVAYYVPWKAFTHTLALDSLQPNTTKNKLRTTWTVLVAKKFLTPPFGARNFAIWQNLGEAICISVPLQNSGGKLQWFPYHHSGTNSCRLSAVKVAYRSTLASSRELIQLGIRQSQHSSVAVLHQNNQSNGPIAPKWSNKI